MLSQDWKVRVTQEKSDLDEKLGKLTEFLKTDMENVPSRQRDLLKRQHELMLGYSGVLAERLK